MRPSALTLAWQSGEAMDEALCHLSYALFRTDGRFGEVVAARLPDRRLVGVGESLHARLALDGEAMAYLTRHDGDPTPLFVLSEAGLGLLSKRYDLHVGLGLYLHIHCPPDAGARLLCSGVLGPETAYRLSARIRTYGGELTRRDAAAYEALATAWATVRASGSCALSTVNAFSRISTEDLGALLERMASFVGCELEVETDLTAAGIPLRQVRCYRPLLLEALLLCLLSEVREHAYPRRATARIGSIDAREGAGLSLTLTYAHDPSETSEAERLILADAHAHLALAADLAGLSLRVASQRRSAGDTTLPTRRILLRWLADPTVLESGDLKARVPVWEEDELLDEELL